MNILGLISVKIDSILKKIFYKKKLASQATAMSGYLTLHEWEKSGFPVPPPSVYKQKVVAEFQKRFNISHLIETGTFTGEMVEATKNIFKKIDSIEIDKKLQRTAAKKFSPYKHIQIFLGDSKMILPQLIQNKNKPVIYWLDGHYSWGVTGKGEKITPIMDELNTVFSKFQDDILLIDDARKFTGKNDYPTMEELITRVEQFDKSLNLEVINDVIRIYRGEKLHV